MPTRFGGRGADEVEEWGIVAYTKTGVERAAQPAAVTHHPLRALTYHRLCSQAHTSLIATC